MTEPSDSAVTETRDDMQAHERNRLLAGDPQACEHFAQWLIDNDVLTMLLRDVLPLLRAVTHVELVLGFKYYMDRRLESYLDEILTEDDARKETWQRMKPDGDEAYDIAGSV